MTIQYKVMRQGLNGVYNPKYIKIPRLNIYN